MAKHHLCILMASLLVAVTPAHAEDEHATNGKAEAREHFDKGLAAFALEHYAEAAEEYEKAFTLRTDSALLYNAAQAHRLAGHYERALKLYQSYLRLFGKKVRNAENVKQHIDELSKIVAAQAKEKDRPPVDVIAPAPAQPEAATATTAPAASAPEPVAVAPAQKANDARPDVVAARPRADKPLAKRPWFWITVGGAVVAVGVGVGLGVGLTRGPSPSFGATTVQ